MSTGSGRQKASAGNWPHAAPSSETPTTSTGLRRKRCTPPASRRPTSPIATGSASRPSPSSLHPEDREQSAERKRRHDDRDDHRDNADCRRLSDAEALERNDVETVRNAGRVLARASGGQHVDRVEGMHDEQRSQQTTQLDEGSPQRKGDGAKCREAVAPVDEGSRE